MKNSNTINFSYNWNNKLICKAFTTIRLYNPNKYVIGSIKDVELKGNFQFEAEIIDTKQFLIEQLNEYMSYLDSGYSLTELKEILYKMYPFIKKKPKTVFSLILLKRHKI